MLFHRPPLCRARRAAALKGIPVFSLLTPHCRQPSRLVLQTVAEFWGRARVLVLLWTGVKLPGNRLPETSSSQERSKMPLTPSGTDRSWARWGQAVPTEKSTDWAPRRTIAPGLQSPLPLVGPPACHDAGHALDTRWGAGVGMAGAMLLGCPTGLSPHSAGLAGQRQGSWGGWRCRGPPLVLPAPAQTAVLLSRRGSAAG